MADCEDSDDDALIDALHVQSMKGRLILRNAITINGIRYEPATYALQHLGPPPPLGEHDWVDIRNKTVKNGSMCRKCGKLRAENV